jgi:altronate hydrolase
MCRTDRRAFERNPITGENPLADFPNVDGVVALTHKTGCGMTMASRCACCAARSAATRGTRTSPRRHRHRPRLRGEPARRMLAEQKLEEGRTARMDIQEMGGTRKTVEAGIAFVKEVLPRRTSAARAGAGQRAHHRRCNAAARTAIPASPPTRRWARRRTCWCATAAR